MDALDGFRLSDGGNPELTTDYEVYPTQSAADHIRYLPWAYGKRCGVSTGSALATLHGAFLPQRLQSRAANQGSRREHMLKAVHVRETREAVSRKVRAIVNLCAARMNTAANLVEQDVQQI